MLNLCNQLIMQPLSNCTICFQYICRTQAPCHGTNRAMVSEGEAVFGHICHEERRPELVSSSVFVTLHSPKQMTVIVLLCAQIVDAAQQVCEIVLCSER